jgi:hypothetical protein
MDRRRSLKVGESLCTDGPRTTQDRQWTYNV